MLNSFRSLQQTKKEADLYIRPEVDQFGRFEWKAFHKLVGLGYSSAKKEIEGWEAAEAVDRAAD